MLEVVELGVSVPALEVVELGVSVPALEVVVELGVSVPALEVVELGFSPSSLLVEEVLSLLSTTVDEVVEEEVVDGFLLFEQAKNVADKAKIISIANNFNFIFTLR